MVVHFPKNAVRPPWTLVGTRLLSALKEDGGFLQQVPLVLENEFDIWNYAHKVGVWHSSDIQSASRELLVDKI